VANKEAWARPEVRQHDVKKRRPKVDGTVMFPTTHDITPAILEPCIEVLRQILSSGNFVLIVSKPHLSCIQRLCTEFASHKDDILFRFTIGAFNDSILGYWEPGAPAFLERFDSLKHAFNQGFSTSISVEPMLDSDRIVELYDMLEPFVTDAIWIGKMNKVRKRVDIENEEDESQVARIEAGQTDDRIWAIYRALQDRSKVKWKESIKEVVGLPLATEAGSDE
jgi:DNA repair photolyase